MMRPNNDQTIKHLIIKINFKLHDFDQMKKSQASETTKCRRLNACQLITLWSNRSVCKLVNALNVSAFRLRSICLCPNLSWQDSLLSSIKWSKLPLKFKSISLRQIVILQFKIFRRFNSRSLYWDNRQPTMNKW